MGVLRRFRLVLLPLVVVAVLSACGGSQANAIGVTAREYTFEGLPSSIRSGATSFRIENRGNEVHELHIFELDDAVGTVAELIGRSQDESMESLTSVGMAVADPGDESSFDADLSAGRYAAVCLIPVGTLPEEGHSGHDSQDMEDMVFDPNADTHFRRGMYSEFTVG